MNDHDANMCQIRRYGICVTLSVPHFDVTAYGSDSGDKLSVDVETFL